LYLNILFFNIYLLSAKLTVFTIIPKIHFELVTSEFLGFE